MKKYVSIWMLASRGSIVKAIGVMILMAFGQIGVYYMALRAALAEREAELQEQLLHPEYGTWDVPYPSLETILQDGLLAGWLTIETVWIIGFLLMAAVLATAGAPLRGGNSQIQLTLQRMSMKEWKIQLCYAFYNFAVMIIYWAFSVVMALVICELYFREADPSTFGPQATFLMFYRNDLFHSVLPLAEVTRYARNVFLFLATGVLTSGYSFWNRRGKHGFSWIMIALLYLGIQFPKGLGHSSSDIWMIFVCAAFIIGEAYHVMSHLEDSEQK